VSHYDLAILNATLVDGTGGQPRAADVAVKGDRIVKVGDVRHPAKRVIDAYGKVLTPGFVDLHGHSDYALFIDPLARSKVYQGVTTEIGGNCGYHAAPIFGAVARERRDEYARSAGLNIEWSTSADYRGRMQAMGVSMNYGQQIGYNTLRSAVTGDHAKPLNAGERDELRKLVRAEYRQGGAVGLSYGIAYPPACFARTEELVDAAEVSAEEGGFVSFHIRNEDDKLLESLEEALHIGRVSSAKVHIGHLKTFRRANWHKIDAALRMLEEARRAGMDLTIDRYPYLAMNTKLLYALPMWALDGGPDRTRAHLSDAATRERLANELRQTIDGEAAEIMVALVSKATNKGAEGQFLDVLAQGRDPWHVMLELLQEEGEAAFATFFGMSRENLDRILSLDYTIVASDSSVQAVDKHAGGGRPHPRCFDTFPYFLAEWVFLQRAMPIEEGIRRITSLPAKRAGIAKRGLVAEDWHADIVLLDPRAFRAEPSYEEPMRYPSGIETVVVNGTVVVDSGRHTGARPGRFLTASPHPPAPSP
jgi:N-acyl-D-aspartate/D-glutamate deacylase